MTGMVRLALALIVAYCGVHLNCRRCGRHSISSRFNSWKLALIVLTSHAKWLRVCCKYLDVLLNPQMTSLGEAERSTDDPKCWCLSRTLTGKVDRQGSKADCLTLAFHYARLRLLVGESQYYEVQRVVKTFDRQSRVP